MPVLFKGQESVKNIDGQDRKVIPFAGTDREGEFSQMGVGLIYSDIGSGQIWGLVMPHNVVASYRGMRIAEEVPTFGHGTLAACWYAGNRDVHPSDQKYITDIEGMIGADKRAQILAAPLPSFDDAIRLMIAQGIRFDVDPFLEEIEQGSLTMTKPLEDAVQAFSDEVLVFRGVKGDYRTALDALKGSRNEGLLAKAKRYFARGQQEGVAREYVAKIEAMLPRVLPDFERIYVLLKDNMATPIEDASQFRDWLKEHYEQENSGITQSTAKVDNALTQLRVAPSRKMTSQQKMVLYYDAMYSLIDGLRDIAHHFSSLARWDGCKEEGMQRHSDDYIANEGLAKTLVKQINRGVQEHMQGVYALR